MLTLVMLCLTFAMAGCAVIAVGAAVVGRRGCGPLLYRWGRPAGVATMLWWALQVIGGAVTAGDSQPSRK